jgi:Flp pilus assembly protein TadB
MSGDRAAHVSVLAAEREGPMIQPQSGSTGIRPVHAFVVIGTLVVAAVVAFAALHFIVGLLWFFVKLVVVLALVYFVARMVLRHARR